MSEHARIQEFLQQRNIIPLEQAEGGEGVIKAGVVPFLAGKPRLYCIHRPVGKHPKLGPTPFQLCKGTRMRHMEDGTWQDVRDEKNIGGDMESLIVTALREGIEELGLVLDGIGAIYDMGPYRFASAQSMREKVMWLFALKMTSKDSFLPGEAIAATTAERRWMSEDEFDTAGRGDHRRILREIEARLAVHFQE